MTVLAWHSPGDGVKIQAIPPPHPLPPTSGEGAYARARAGARPRAQTKP